MGASFLKKRVHENDVITLVKQRKYHNWVFFAASSGAPFITQISVESPALILKRPSNLAAKRQQVAERRIAEESISQYLPPAIVWIQYINILIVSSCFWSTKYIVAVLQINIFHINFKSISTWVRVGVRQKKKVEIDSPKYWSSVELSKILMSCYSGTSYLFLFLEVVCWAGGVSSWPLFLPRSVTSPLLRGVPEREDETSTDGFNPGVINIQWVFSKIFWKLE